MINHVSIDIHGKTTSITATQLLSQNELHDIMGKQTTRTIKVQFNNGAPIPVKVKR